VHGDYSCSGATVSVAAAVQVLACDEPGTDAGTMSAKVAENIRPMVMAGLAKLVEDVKKYAAPM
jgi:hypothetical protein